MPRRDMKPLAKALLARFGTFAEVEMTRQIVAAAKPLGVIVHDHIIVGKQGHASFCGLGLI
jgi:DNA repair protein RadC